MKNDLKQGRGGRQICLPLAAQPSVPGRAP